MIGLFCTVVMEVSGVSAPCVHTHTHTHTHDVVCTMYIHTHSYWSGHLHASDSPLPLKGCHQDTKHIKRDNAFGAAKEGYLCSCDGGKEIGKTISKNQENHWKVWVAMFLGKATPSRT